MKKLILIAAVAFTACNSGQTEAPATSCDSTCVDSCKTIVIDTVVKVDSVKTIVDTIKK